MKRGMRPGAQRRIGWFRATHPPPSRGQALRDARCAGSSGMRLFFNGFIGLPHGEERPGKPGFASRTTQITRYHRIMLWACSRRSRGVAEDRRQHPVAGLDAEPGGGAAVQLDDRPHRRRRGDHVIRLRHRPLVNVDDPALRIDKQHVERDQRVAHPHRRHNRLLVVEQHSGVWRQLAAEHQALHHLLGRFGNLDGKAMPPAGADDRQARGRKALQLTLGCRHQKSGGEQGPGGEQGQ